MRKSFYLSTRKDRSAQAAELLEALAVLGWERTYVWTEQDISPDGYADIASAELAGVRQADVLVVLLPGGYGTHVEIGVALALGKPVILHAPDRKTLEMPYPCVFHYHAGVHLSVGSHRRRRRRNAHVDSSRKYQRIENDFFVLAREFRASEGARTST